MDRTGEIGMNKTINYPAPKWQDKCPDCGFKYMNIWKHGRIHCGKCLAGGHFTANKYKSIKDKYFKNIVNLLKNDGAFITRDNVVPDRYTEAKTMPKIFTKYLKKITNEELTIKQVATHLGNEMSLASWYTNDENKCSTKYVEKSLLYFGEVIKGEKNPSQELKLLVKLYDYFISVWYRLAKDKYWTYYLKKDNDEMLKKYFKIKDELYAKDYGKLMTEASPMYLLKK